MHIYIKIWINCPNANENLTVETKRFWCMSVSDGVSTVITVAQMYPIILIFCRYVSEVSLIIYIDFRLVYFFVKKKKWNISFPVVMHFCGQSIYIYIFYFFLQNLQFLTVTYFFSFTH